MELIARLALLLAGSGIIVAMAIMWARHMWSILDEHGEQTRAQSQLNREWAALAREQRLNVQPDRPAASVRHLRPVQDPKESS